MDPRRLNQLITVFGAALKSGLLTPAAKTTAREIGEAAVSRPVQAAEKSLGLIGERAAAISGRAPSAYPESMRGLLGAGAVKAPIPRAATPAPLPRIGMNAPTQAVPLEGRQLDMLSGMNRLTYPAGTKTAEGFAVGGRTFNPADVMPEGQYTQRIRELARSKGVPEELFIQQMRNPGASLADEINFAEIPAQTGLLSKPLDFGVYQARNLMQQTGRNLADLIKANPRMAAAAAATAGAGGIGYGISRMAQGAPAAPVLPGRMGPTTADVSEGNVSDPMLKTTAQMIAEGMSSAPGISAQLEAPSYRGAERTAISTRGDADESVRAAKAQYIKPESALEKYYKQREAYANYPAHKAMIISTLQKQGVLDTPELVTWAGANPTLAYELYRKLPSQQVPQPTQVTITAPMGSNNANNSVGNSVSLGEGAIDLYNATQPSANLEINPIPTDIIGRLQQSVLLGR